ncbi:MAG: helix-turn-helix domain-containing protein [Ruminococcaceae bacterium]|nr:helix-turn-helix domain-containing protein [Oscillospiraceae bacterium]
MDSKTRENLPLLLKRKHLKDIGISDGLYYKLVKSKELPVVKLNGRNYINRDALFALIDKVK